MKNEWKFTNSIIYLFLVINIILLIIKSYNSDIHSAYINNYKYFSDNKIFINDIYLKKNYIYSSSFYYHLLYFLKINIDNDIIGFVFNSLILLTSCTFIFLIIKDFLHINDKKIILCFIITLANTNGLLLQFIRSSWADTHTASPSMLALSLNFLLVFFVLKNFFFRSIIIASFSVLISIKSSWFAVGVLITYFGLKKIRLSKKILLFLPILILIYLGAKNNLFLNPEDHVQLYNNSIEREQAQSIFNLHGNIRLIFFCISFVIFYFLNKNTKNIELKFFCNLTLFSTISMFIFFFITYQFDILILKRFELIALSPVRAVWLYEFIFFLLLLNFIYKYSYSFFGVFLFLPIYFFNFNNKNLIFLFILLIIIILHLLKFKKNIIQIISIFCFVLFILTSSLYLLKKKSYFNSYAFEKIKKWGVEINNSKIDLLLNIKKCNDFVFHDLTFEKSDKWTNYISQKSRFIADKAMFYNSIELINIVNERNRIIFSLKNNIINKKKVSINDINELNNLRVVFLIKKSDEILFTMNVIKIQNNSDYSLIIFGYKDFKCYNF